MTRRAQARLRGFRRATALSLILTALLLWVFERSPAAGAQLKGAAEATEEATRTLGGILHEAYSYLPKLLFALAIALIGWTVARLARALIQRLLADWSRASAASALASVTITLLTAGVALSVLAGDVRALIGSVGLIGLALSWALQAPIESFTGWLVNSFKGYYRIGDRIEVGDVFGDVYQIDVLTTTVWEAGGEGKSVKGAQPTGALITFPNSDLLRANIINYTRDFPFVWDEVVQAISNDSDVDGALELIRTTAEQVVGPPMGAAIKTYQAILRKGRLALDVNEKPQVYLSAADAWTNFTIRYLVPARERRRWSSLLIEALAKALAAPEVSGRVNIAYPRAELDVRARAPEASSPDCAPQSVPRHDDSA